MERILVFIICLLLKGYYPSKINIRVSLGTLFYKLGIVTFLHSVKQQVLRSKEFARSVT